MHFQKLLGIVFSRMYSLFKIISDEYDFGSKKTHGGGDVQLFNLSALLGINSTRVTIGMNLLFCTYSVINTDSVIESAWKSHMPRMF